MSDSVSRIPDGKASALNTPTASKEDPSLKLVVDNASDYQRVESSLAGLKTIQSPLDRVARERVFDAIVRKTLDNPEHPYYSLVDSGTRKEMIQRITALLDSSHYLTQNKRQA